jgi:hypothetical protein
MKQITEITDDYNQKLDIVTEDNQSFELKLTYSDQQQGWFYSIAFEDIAINGSRLVTGANILRSYQNVLPFGIAVTTDDLSEPVFLDDFSTQRVGFFLLTEEEVQGIETDFYNN